MNFNRNENHVELEESVLLNKPSVCTCGNEAIIYYGLGEYKCER